MLKRSLLMFSVLAVVSAAAAQPPAATPPPAKPTEPVKPDAQKPAAPAEAAKPATAEAKVVYVKMSTSMGDIIIELNNEKAPISTANFLSYVDKKFYDGVIFHRVIPDFMIQGGGFDKDMNQKSVDKPIKNEWQNGLKNVRGSISMARTNAADSERQFFINVDDNNGTKKYNLDAVGGGGAAYAVFGKVTAGMDVVDKIRAVKTTRPPHGDVPVDPVVIISAVRITPEQAAAAATGTAPAPAKPSTEAPKAPTPK